MLKDLVFFFGLVGNCKCSVWDRAHGTVNSQSAVKNKRIKVQTSRQLKKVLLKVSSERNSSSCLFLPTVLIHEMPAASGYIYDNYNTMTVNSYNIKRDV